MPELAPPTALAGLAEAVPPIHRPGLAGLRQAWFARLRPCDAAERAAADGFVAQVWLAHRLDAVEERLLGALIEGRPVDGLPSLATLVRARARLERDRERALADLESARRTPPAALPEELRAEADPEPAASPPAAELAEPAELPEVAGFAAHEAPEPGAGAAPAAAVASVHAAPEPAAVAWAHEAPERGAAPRPAWIPPDPGHAPPRFRAAG